MDTDKRHHPEEIFQLDPRKMQTQIYGSNGQSVQPIRTDSSGQLKLSPLSSTTNSIKAVIAESFINISESVTTIDDFSGSKPQNISLLSNTTFFIMNTGPTHQATVIIQTSPDGINWVDNFFGGSTISSGKIYVDTPSYALQYARVNYKSTVSGNPTTLTIIFQAKT